MKKDLFEFVHWEDVRWDMQYPESDNNKGLIYGINTLDDNNEVIEVFWFKTEKKRNDFIKKNNLVETNWNLKK